jgi:hypothetical protein
MWVWLWQQLNVCWAFYLHVVLYFIPLVKRTKTRFWNSPHFGKRKRYSERDRRHHVPVVISAWTKDIFIRVSAALKRSCRQVS